MAAAVDTPPTTNGAAHKPLRGSDKSYGLIWSSQRTTDRLDMYAGATAVELQVPLYMAASVQTVMAEVYTEAAARAHIEKVSLINGEHMVAAIQHNARLGAPHVNGPGLNTDVLVFVPPALEKKKKPRAEANGGEANGAEANGAAEKKVDGEASGEKKKKKKKKADGEEEDGSDGGKKKKARESALDTYGHRLQKDVDPELNMRAEALEISVNFAEHVHKLLSTAAGAWRAHAGRKTLQPQDVLLAVNQLMLPDLAHACELKVKEIMHTRMKANENGKD